MDAEVGHMICFLEWFCHNSKLDLGHVCIGFESFSLGAEKTKRARAFIRQPSAVFASSGYCSRPVGA